MQDGSRNKGGRPPKTPTEGRRPTVTFRCRPNLQKQLQDAAALSGRSVSEEIERRLEETFARQSAADAAAKAVVDVKDALDFAHARSTQTVFATLDEYEKYCGGRDACSFGYHVGKRLAICIKEEFSREDLLGNPLSAPPEELNSSDVAWYDNDTRREHIRSKVLKSASSLFEIWDFVQTSSPIPSVGWRISPRVADRIASGEFDRKPDDDLGAWNISGAGNTDQHG